MPPGTVTNAGALLVDVTAGNVSVTGFSYNLICAAWWHNLRPLSLGGPDVRGSERIVPGGAAVEANPRRPTVTQYALEMVISGYVHPDGSPYTDPYAGLEANVALLVGLYNPLQTTPKASTLTLPSGATRHASVFYEKLEPGDQAGAIMKATGHITIPVGWFT